MRYMLINNNILKLKFMSTYIDSENHHIIEECQEHYIFMMTNILVAQYGKLEAG